MKKAFTLVELLAVIVIMIMLFGIVTANLNSIINKASEKEYERVSTIVENAAEMYIDTESPSELETIGGTYCVTLSALDEKGLIDLPIVDPRNDTEFDEITCVLVTKLSNTEYNYELDPDYNDATITLIGDSPDTISCVKDQNYIDLGASVYDPGDLTAANIYATETLSLQTAGEYFLKYNYTNDYGTNTATRKVVITNTNQPIIEIEDGISEIELEVEDTLNAPLAIATDICDGSIEVVKTIDFLTSEAGTHYIKYTATNSGGTSTKRLVKVTIGTTIVAENLDTSGASVPELASNMIPVYYDTTCASEASNCWKKADETNTNASYQWYDYDAKMWANAVTVTEASRASHLSDSLGTTIPDADILTFMVWIPRYKYKIATGGTATPSSIDIVFEDSSTSKSTGNATTTYRTHPGFTFGTQELEGIWIGKFEVSNNISLIKIIPNLTVINNQNVSSFFNTIRAMESVGNAYGYINTEVDTHMTKNSEWGATAYLTYSNYGFNQEVWINPDSSLLTGRAGTGPSVGETASTYKYNHSTFGVNASTTGNVYGIYDMSGLTNEYIAGNYGGLIGSSGFSSMPDSKYYDQFSTDVVSTACGGICYGQALSETLGWNGDNEAFVSSVNPWIQRSRNTTSTTTAGIFAIGRTTGVAGMSTRVTQITE